MKYLKIILLLISSLILFSCATSKINSELEDNQNSVEIPEEETQESLTNAEDQNETIEKNTEETEASPDKIHEPLDEIVEPEVIDAELPPEEEIKIISEENSDIPSENIEDAETEILQLPPVEENIADYKESAVQTIAIKPDVKQEQEKTATSTPAVSENKQSGTENNNSEKQEDEIIDVSSDDNAEVTIENEQVIIPSRSVTVKKSEYVDITYPGNGWIYIGLTDNSKDLVYNGRQIGTINTKFSLQAKNSGTKIAHFYKNDALTGDFLDDYVEIVVTNEKGSNKTHVDAPEYKSSLPENIENNKEASKKEEAKQQSDMITEKNTETAKNTTAATTNSNTSPKGNSSTAAAQKTVPDGNDSKINSTASIKTQSAATVQNNSDKTQETSQNAVEKTDQTDTNQAENIDTADLLKEAANLFNNKNYKDALAKLKTFFEYSDSNRDEALYLQGQIYEAQSDVQNINAAINSYTTLTVNYPASKYWDDANKRVIYLKRFYLEGR